jgi:ADP-ribose pyrophosphatase YjhB (NUDIX family)
VEEEAGLQVKAKRLLAVLDKKCHAHPPDLYYVYKLFFLCEESGGVIGYMAWKPAMSVFSRSMNCRNLSIGRNTFEQIEAMFQLRE